MNQQYYPTSWKLSLIYIAREEDLAAIIPLDSILTWICLHTGMAALI